jgi:pimeloyl-ACP methyl ester carboxylesterase
LSKIEPGALLTLSGKPTRAAQYAIGNPLLAIQMIEHAPEVALLVLLDTYYGQSPTLRFPEFVSLFADPAYTALTRAIIQNPAVAQWLLAWQGGQFGGDEQVQQSLLSIIGPQFVGTPSTFPPFIGLTSDLHATVQATTRRLPDLKAFARPVRIIFGAEDPYLDPGVARSLHEALPTSDLSLLPKKGHWSQLDSAPEVAQLLLSIPEV